MIQWEYETVMIDDYNSRAYLNSYGKDGWELVNVVNHGDQQIAYFKRQKNL